MRRALNPQSTSRAGAVACRRARTKAANRRAARSTKRGHPNRPAVVNSRCSAAQALRRLPRHPAAVASAHHPPQSRAGTAATAAAVAAMRRCGPAPSAFAPGASHALPAHPAISLRSRSSPPTPARHAIASPAVMQPLAPIRRRKCCHYRRECRGRLF